MTNPIIEYWPNGNKRFEKYYLNGIRHRDPLEGPAIIEYYKNGEIKRTDYWVNDELHNPHNPAFIWYYLNGNKRSESYIENGMFHRDPEIGPANVLYYDNGQIEKIEYWVNDKLHNPHTPAFIWYYSNGNKKREEWYLNHKLNNIYGPAWICYKHNVFEWYLNDKEYTKKVNEYLNTNNLNYKTMTRLDFDIMWSCIL